MWVPNNLGERLRQHRVLPTPTFAEQLWHIVQLVVIGARRVQVPRMAAALSYRTIFGLIPMLVVAVVFLAAFSKPEDVSLVINKTLNFAGLSSIMVEPPKDESQFFDESPVAHAANPAGARKLDEWIAGLVQKVRSLPPGSLRLIGFAMLIYAAISMVVEIEKTFNQIYLAPAGRSWARRIARYWSLLTLGAIGLVASFTAQEFIQTQVENLTKVSIISGLSSFLLSVSAFLIPTFISTAFLLIIYMSVPNTRVQFRPALLGAFLAALCWEGGKHAFTWYLRHSMGYSTLYGPIAALPLFLIWVYATWIIVLVGLQVAHAFQSYNTAKAAGLTRSVLETLGLLADAAASRKSLMVDASAILVVAAVVAQRFASGKTTDHSHVADSTGIDERAVADMLQHLASAGVLHRVEGDQEGSYTLARPPEAILAPDVLRVGEEMSAVDRDRAPRLFHDLREQRVSSMTGRSLADLAGITRAQEPQPAPPPATT